jgi:hypothetical protein
MKHVSNDKPEIAVPNINEIIESVNHKAPRVKLGFLKQEEIWRRNFHPSSKSQFPNS